MRKIFLFLFAAVLSIGTASAITVTVVDDYWSQSTFTGVTYDESTYTWSQEYAVGETVTIGIDEAGADMYIVYWTVNESEERTYSETFTFTAEEDVTIYPHFAAGMDLTVTNLEMNFDMGYDVVLIGTDNDYGLEFMIAIGEDNGDGTYKVDPASMVLYEEEPQTVISGTITSIDVMNNEATVFLIGEIAGGLMAMNINMSLVASAAPVDVMVADATVTYSDDDGALKFSGTDVYSNDAVFVELAGFEYNGVGEYTLNVMQISMFENSTAFAFADEVTVAVDEDGYVSVEGTYTSLGDGSIYNVFIWGSLPKYTLTLTSDVSDAVLTGAGTYYAAQEVTVTATPEPTGLVFDYWSDGAEKVSTSATYTFRLGKDLELVANYKEATTTPEEPEVTEITLTEGNNSSALATTGVVTVTVEREFKMDELYTIALPFTINNAASVFGNGTVVYNFANLAYDKTNEVYILGFTIVNKIEAGKPYLIKPGQDVNGFVAENVTLSDATSISQKVKVDNVEKTATMTAVLSETTTGGSYWLAENNFLYNGDVYMPALRALFVLPTTPSGMPARARVALDENAETGLDNITTGEKATKAIVNGQLVIIRDGEMYNVQGQKL